MLVLFIIFILLGYFIFSDKKAILSLIRGSQSIVPVSAPDYSDDDRKRLDSILNEANP
ncbi:MAG: hypothetical protein WCK42_00555 [Myxococcaceae bacterium]